jgi:hypothetical protein
MPYPGDHGIQFTPMSEQDKAVLEVHLARWRAALEERVRLMREGKLPPIHQRAKADIADPDVRAAS